MYIAMSHFMCPRERRGGLGEMRVGRDEDWMRARRDKG